MAIEGLCSSSSCCYYSLHGNKTHTIVRCPVVPVEAVMVARLQQRLHKEVAIGGSYGRLQWEVAMGGCNGR